MKIDLIKIIEKKAKEKPVKVVICEGWDERCLKAVDELLRKGLVDIILLDNGHVKDVAKKLKVDISKSELIDFKNSDLKEELVSKLVEIRKHKGMVLEDAKKLILDENYFACMYVYCGYADAVAGSAICPTAGLMRPTLQILREKGKVVSEVSILSDVKNNHTLFATDFSLNIDPSAEELAQISIYAASCVDSFGIEPKVALLSFSTKGSGGDGVEVQVIRDAVDIVKKQEPNLLIDGELQMDAALSEFGYNRKCPNSPLKGDANTLIFPDLTSSNIFCHGLLQLSDVGFEFTVLTGLIKPVSILGRSTPLSTVRNMIVGCAMQVNSK